jgi:DNA-binding PadR family transcriptional regulator
MSVEKTTTVESLLGVLSLRPMSGYQMRQMMEQSTANFWSESFGQIYPALKGMLRDGLVELVEGSAVEKVPKDARERKVYRITEAGLRRLRQWLQVPARPQVNRDELLLKVFFGDRAGPGVIAGQVQLCRQRFEADLARYQATEHKIQTLYPQHPAMPFWRMTVRYGMAEARMVMDWCDATLEELQSAGSRKQEVGNRN